MPTFSFHSSTFISIDATYFWVWVSVDGFLMKDKNHIEVTGTRTFHRTQENKLEIYWSYFSFNPHSSIRCLNHADVIPTIA